MDTREALGDQSRGALWVVPAVCGVVALAAGAALSYVDVDPRSPLAFQGTAEDARAMLVDISGTMITVIALLLGLTVVALQLSSTQFSPRLLRNFLRDRPNQIVLGAFVGTFAYSAGGLFTVGVAGGRLTDDFPRLAVSVAIGLLFVSLGLLVYFADHLVHSIQVENIMGVVERNALPAVRAADFSVETETPEPPASAVAVPAPVSGYLQRVDMSRLAADARAFGVAVRLRPRVGEHVVAGTVLAWVWPTGGGPTAGRPTAGGAVGGGAAGGGAAGGGAAGGGAVDPAAAGRVLAKSARIGFERTLEQDAAFGLRQLIDMACKALSPAVNDPYTAVQAIEHLTVLYGALAARPVGDRVVRDPGGEVVVVVPGRRFDEHLSLGCGLIRRYGAGEPTVAFAVLRMLATCAELAGDDRAKRAAVAREAELLLDAAERETVVEADLESVRRQGEVVRRAVA
jgi:uncharacterized membrane protein